MSTIDPDTPELPATELLRQQIVKRLQALAARVPEVRADVKTLRAKAGEIDALRARCRSFVEGEHQELNQLATAAAAEIQSQTEQIQNVNTDLKRSVEIAGLFVAARAESWLRCETLIVSPACEWSDFAKGQSLDFEKRMERLREWFQLKSPRWAPSSK